MQTSHQRPAIILLAEDDSGDQELTRRALLDEQLSTELHIVGDGEEAREYLRREGDYDATNAPRPELILLDLNMPRVDGRQFLTWMRSDAEFRTIPVIILTTSQQEEDIIRSYDLGCNSFITKPVDIDKFMEVVRRLGSYWFDLVTLPSNRGQRPCLLNT